MTLPLPSTFPAAYYYPVFLNLSRFLFMESVSWPYSQRLESFGSVGRAVVVAGGMWSLEHRRQHRKNEEAQNA